MFAVFCQTSGVDQSVRLDNVVASLPPLTPARCPVSHIPASNAGPWGPSARASFIGRAAPRGRSPAPLAAAASDGLRVRSSVRRPQKQWSRSIWSSRFDVDSVQLDEPGIPS
ncbi:unnamed protein product [Prorocentrum cordatum]|uniref:Uncharacterized protein n=1 Tax=Prorocentrum cordatum TaxID=2364126 RepID=A0ABN9VNV0_9DINO|nr:unnamed protein product [Polarella glacialis]